jgi:hypothetical protein
MKGYLRLWLASSGLWLIWECWWYWPHRYPYRGSLGTSSFDYLYGVGMSSYVSLADAIGYFFLRITALPIALAVLIAAPIVSRL